MSRLLSVFSKIVRKYSVSWSVGYSVTKDIIAVVSGEFFLILLFPQKLFGSLKNFTAFYLWSSKFCPVDYSVEKLFLVILFCCRSMQLEAYFGKQFIERHWLVHAEDHITAFFHSGTLYKKRAVLKMERVLPKLEIITDVNNTAALSFHCICSVL